MPYLLKIFNSGKFYTSEDGYKLLSLVYFKTSNGSIIILPKQYNDGELVSLYELSDHALVITGASGFKTFKTKWWLTVLPVDHQVIKGTTEILFTGDTDCVVAIEDDSVVKYRVGRYYDSLFFAESSVSFIE